MSNANTQNQWFLVSQKQPTDDSQDYLVYSMITEVYEKVSLKELLAMVNNSAKITHWRYLPSVPTQGE